MRLFNTLTQALETFSPQEEPVTLYVCGITPYDTTHLGHAFTYASADLLTRYLEYLGKKVRYVQNVTDIDDDILRKARQEGENWQALGNQWTAHFIEDMEMINIRPPDYYPRATETIPEIIELISRLLDKGLGYISGGSVYYDIARWPEYGRLSHLSRAEMLPIANQRGNHPEDPHKRNPLDFVLWQAHVSGEPAWDSPWGPGRPGWHIECSAMATSLLGSTIDVHMGGADLIFPHHESEIAQVVPVTGKSPFARIWMHTAMVRYQGEKMSKSLGNLVMVRDLLKEWSADTLRVLLACNHYRNTWSYDTTQLQQASEITNRLHNAVTLQTNKGESFDYHPYRLRYLEAMENDLDAPAALRSLDDLAAAVETASRKGKDISQAQHEIRDLGSIFGLRFDAGVPEKSVSAGWQKILKQFRDN